MRETLVKTEEFKDSPLGKIPQRWEVVRLGEIADLITSGSRGWATYYSDKGALFLRVGNLTREHLNLRLNDIVHVCPPVSSEGARAKVQAGDLLISITADLGMIGVIPKNFREAYVNQHIALVRLNQSQANPRWVGNYLAGAIGQKKFYQLNDAGAKAGLNLSAVAALLVALPPKKEQDCIAEILDTLDETIAHTSSLIAKLKQMKAGLLHDLLTRGLDENGELRDAIAHPEQFKDSPLGRIPKDWEVCQLRDFYAVPARNRLYKPAKFYGRGVLMIHMPQMFRGLTIDVSDAARVDVNPSELERFSLAVGDLVFARRSLNLEGAGRCSLVPALSEPTTFESSIIRVRLSTDKLRPIFANYFLNSETGFRLRLPLIRQVAVSGVSSEDIASIPVPCPPPEEQDAIIKIIDTHDTRIRAEESYRDKLKLQKQGLMHDLLTGKVRVKI